jgi:hypothetical protein
MGSVEIPLRDTDEVCNYINLCYHILDNIFAKILCYCCLPCSLVIELFFDALPDGEQVIQILKQEHA